MKKYGIRITLAEGNPMGLPHLLGDDWESVRWYETEAERERAMADLSRRLPNYRQGDEIAQVFTRIEV
jgi:hypothetical protein